MSKAKHTETEAVPEYEYTWHDSISGWEAARVGYARQQAAAAKAAKKLPPPKTREEAMDRAARETFAKMDRINAEVKAYAHKIMTAPGPAHEPQPSTGTEPWRGYIGVDGPIVTARRMRGW
jgi:hypothetical protein